MTATQPRPREHDASADVSARQAHGVALYLGVRSSAMDAAEAATLFRDVLESLAHRHPSVVVCSSGLVSTAVDGEEHEAAAVRRTLQGAPGGGREELRGDDRSPNEDSANPRRAAAEPGAQFDFSRNRVIVEGTVRSLSYSEFEILRHLVTHECTAVSRSDLLNHLRASSRERTASRRSIDVHIRRLRFKIEPFAGTIRTIRGIGYRFDRTDEIQVVLGETTGSSP